MTIVFHPLAEVFPPTEGAEFKRLWQDIALNGLRDKIVLYATERNEDGHPASGYILDGCNRYRALLELKVIKKNLTFEAIFESGAIKKEYKDYFVTLPKLQDPLAFVISKNLTHRHLDEGQRADVAAKLANLPAYRPANDKSANLRLSQAAAAKALNVSVRSVQSATAVQKKGVPALSRAFRGGKLSLHEAEKAAKLSPAEQVRVAELAEAGQANVVRLVIKETERRIREENLGRRLRADNLILGQKYGVILVAPKWCKTGTDHVNISARVAEMAAADCVLFLWALGIARDCGYTYQTHWVWTKAEPGGGCWNKDRHEILLLGTKGDVPAPAPGMQWDSIITGTTTEHSEKPDSAYRLIEEYFPSLPKVELYGQGLARVWGPDGDNRAAAELGAEAFQEGRA
jgi:N6-adenosine-specific RNA methylase IME4